MRFLAASAVLVTLLFVSGPARADAAEEPGPRSVLVMGRCVEQPMSLAIALTELEAARLSPPRSVMPAADEVPASVRPGSHAAQVGPVGVRVAPTRLICLSPDDPACHVSSLPPAPERSHLEHVDHGFAPPPEPVRLATGTVTEVTLGDLAEGRAHPGHAPAPWRPPAV